MIKNLFFGVTESVVHRLFRVYQLPVHKDFEVPRGLRNTPTGLYVNERRIAFMACYGMSHSWAASDVSMRRWNTKRPFVTVYQRFLPRDLQIAQLWLHTGSLSRWQPKQELWSYYTDLHMSRTTSTDRAGPPYPHPPHHCIFTLTSDILRRLRLAQPPT